MTPKTQILTFPGDPSRLAGIRASVGNFLEGSSLVKTEVARIIMAVDEACTNIIRHAHVGEVKPVRLEMQWLCDRLRFVLLDNGTPFTCGSIPPQNLNHSTPGGLGLFIINEVFDRVEYSPESSGTRLTLEKLIPTLPD